MRTTFAALCLSLAVTACGAEEGSGKGVYRLEFAGERHTQHVTLHPRLSTALPGGSAKPGQPFDLVIRNERGHQLAIIGNGTRSVAFVGSGGAEMFETVCRCRNFPRLQAELKDASVYFSPQLRSEEAVAGTVFLAKVMRDRKQVGAARILIKSVGDTTLEVRVYVGPPWPAG